MGWKTGAAAGAAAGAFGGPVGAAIGASIGAMIGKFCDSSDGDGPIAIWRQGELYFVENGVSLPFSSIGNVNNDEPSYTEITHKGGLRIQIPKDRIAIDGATDADAVVTALCEDTGPTNIEEYFEDGFDEKSPEDIVANIGEALSMVEDAKHRYELINGSDGIVFNEALALVGVASFIANLDSCLYADNEDVAVAASAWKMENVDRLSELIKNAKYWQEKIVDEFAGKEQTLKICSRLCSRLHYQFCYGVLKNSWEENEADEVGYSWIQSGFSDEDLPDEAFWLKWLDEKWAAPDNARHRKVIVCTEEPRALEQVGVVDPENTIMRARDLEKVIERQQAADELETVQGQRKSARASGNDVPMAKAMSLAKEYKQSREERRLVFEVGHPRNNTVYIQHPFAPNTYVELSSFHASMLERKYNELIRILVALGAKHIECSVENADRSEEKTRSKMNANAEVSIGGAAGISGEWGNSRSSSKDVSLYKKLNTEMDLTPKGTPHLPDKLLYYPFEDGWKSVAEDVMAGRLVRAKIDLTYSTDYAVTGQFTSSLKAKIQSNIPGYNFGVNGGIDQEVDAELKKLESTVWHYTVEFGLADKIQVRELGEDNTVEVPTSSDNEMSARDEADVAEKTPDGKVDAPNAEQNKVEVLILKMARLFAKSDGVDLSEMHRKQLFDMGKKYGVDDFHIQELIVDALIDAQGLR